jgi:hypothetical protein
VKLFFTESESWWEAKEASIVFTVIEVNWFRAKLTFALNQQGVLCNNSLHFVISGFRREIDENCTLLGYYAASIRNFLPAFRDNLSIPSSGVL